MSTIIDRFGNPIISEKPASAAYSPAPRHIYWMQPRELPLFTFTMIRFMLVDPTIRLGLAMRQAPLSGLRFASKQGEQWVDGVECKNPKVKEYLDRQIKKCWVTITDKMLTDQIWGWSAGEIMYRVKGGKVVFDNILDRHAVDSRALEKHSRQVGVQFQNTGRPSQIKLGMNKAWWCAFRPEANRFYGDSIMRGAYSPFADKWFDGGALDSARLFMHTDAYSGRSIGCPPGTINLDGIGEVPTRDVAREMAEMMKTGAVVVYPLIYDDRGNKKWDIQPATVSQNPTHILQYPKDLDTQMLRGMEIPDDVLTAEATGSWQGKRVPMQAFYTGLNRWAHTVVDTMRRSILEWLVWWNWGKAIDFDVTFQPLDEQAMEQFKKDQGQGGGGQAGPPGANGAPGPAGPADGGGGGMNLGPPDMGGGGGGGAPPMQLGLDPIRRRDLAVAVGRGVLSANDIVRHARRAARKELRRRMAAESGGEWVTIGGEPRGDKKHAGGTPVKVKGGRVVQGPDHLEGHPVNDLPSKRENGKEGGQNPGSNGRKSPGIDDAIAGTPRGQVPSITGELAAAARDASGLDIDGNPLISGRVGYDDNPNAAWAGRYTVGNQRFATKHAAQAHVRKMRKEQQQREQEASKPKKPSPEQAQAAAAEMARQYRESGTPHAKAAKELIERHIRGIGESHDKAREAAWQGFASLRDKGVLKVDEDGVMYAMKDGEKRPVVVRSNGAPNYGTEPFGDYRRKTLFARRRGEQRDGAPRPVSAQETAQRRKRGLPGANSELGREIEKAAGPDLDDQAAFQGIVDAIFAKRTKAGDKVLKHDKSIINEAKRAVGAFGGPTKDEPAMSLSLDWDESKHPRGDGGQFTKAAHSDHLAEAKEGGKHFQTGAPVSFTYQRNTESAPKFKGSDPYQQKIEPAGRYVTHKDHNGELPKGWESGELSFKNPLVVKRSLDKDKIYGDQSWKANLSKQLGGKTGKSLSQAVADAGHDGIVTVDENGYTSEIVDLTHLRKPEQREKPDYQDAADKQHDEAEYPEGVPPIPHGQAGWLEIIKTLSDDQATEMTDRLSAQFDPRELDHAQWEADNMQIATRNKKAWSPAKKLLMAVADKYREAWATGVARITAPKQDSADDDWSGEPGFRRTHWNSRTPHTEDRAWIATWQAATGGAKRMARDLQEGEGEWVTIGGHKDGDEEHAGGTPVQIGDTGHIEKGPAALKGRHMEDVDTDRKDEHKTEFKPRTKAGAKRRTGAAILHIDDISIDAPRFQYKFEGVGDAGVTRQFSDIEFNPELAGILYVWHDHEDGKSYCVDEATEILTRRGWKRWNEIVHGDAAMTLNHETGRSEWQPILAVHIHAPREREMVLMEGKSHSSLSTLDHRWPVLYLRGGSGKTSEAARRWRTTESLTCWDAIILAAKCDTLPERPVYADDLVELVAWAWTEGSIAGKLGRSMSIHQSHRANPEKCKAIRKSLAATFGRPEKSLQAARLSGSGKSYIAKAAWAERDKEVSDESGMSIFGMTAEASALIMDHLDANKEVKPEFIVALTKEQLAIFVQRCVDGDGWDGWSSRNCASQFVQATVTGTQAFQMACALLGLRTCANWSGPAEAVLNGVPIRSSGCFHTTISKDSSPKTVRPIRRSRRAEDFRVERVTHRGTVWCPTTGNGSWLARRRGTVYYTGNCINGHHRYELAKRSGWKGRLPVRYIDRETAQEARAFGALINIAGGNGTAMDAAKFMRDMGMNGAEGVAHFKKHNISLKGAIAADALKLANLSDNLFRELVYGRLELNHAKAIGEELVPAPNASEEEKFAIYDAQNRLLKRIQGAKKRIPDAVVREMALNASLSPRVKKEGGASLFGDDDEEEVLFEDRAAVQSYVREQLTGLVRGFGAVSASGRENLLRESGVGDVSSEAAAAKKAESQDALGRFEREIRYRGDVGAKLNSVLNDAALKHRNAKSTRDRNEVKKTAVDAVKSILQSVSQDDQGMTSGEQPKREAVAEAKPEKAAESPPASESPPAKEDRTYWYGMPNRPFGVTHLKENLVGTKDHPAFKSHGAVGYSRPLTDDEIKSQQLTPILEGHQIDDAVEKVANEMGDYVDTYLEPDNEEFLMERVNGMLPELGHVDANEIVKRLRKRQSGKQ